MPLRSLSPREVADLRRAAVPPVILDVREPWEYERAHLPDSLHIPMDELHARLGELGRDRTYVVLCHHGNRSRQVAAFLASRGFPNVINLEGGIDAWAESLEPGLPRY